MIKRTYLIMLMFLGAFIMASSCSTKKIMNTEKTLYKTEKGKLISYKSYDRSLALFNVDYESDFVETDYGKAHVIIAGKENDKAIILLPGLFADATMWYPNVGELSKHYKVYALDMPNYGGKSLPSQKVINGINDYKIWFRQILSHYELDKVAVAGLSYGSWLTLALAREIPETISAIMMLDPSETFMPMNGGIMWRGFMAFMVFPNRKKYEKFFDWLGGGYSDDKMDVWFEHMLDVIEFGKCKMTDVPKHKLYKKEELEMIKMPVLVMAGQKPILYKDPELFKSKAIQAIPHAQVIIVPDAGHGLNMEKSDYVNKQMILFLNKVQIKNSKPF